MRIKKYLQLLIFTVFSGLVFCILSCERQDLYSSAEEDVTDTSSPVPGSSGLITASDVTAAGFTLNWTAAADNISDQSSLEYSVYRSDGSIIDTVGNVQTNGTLVTGWTAGITSAPLSGLDEIKYYLVNVLVRDEAGNISVYRMNYYRTADATPPIVAVSVPATACGTLNVSATASDNVGVVRVEFFIGSLKIGESYASPYGCSLDIYNTTDYPFGTYTIRATAYDEQGNSGSDSIDTVFDGSCY